MPKHTWICLFDLAAYDTKAAPALRAYAHRYDPAGVVELLREIMRILPDLQREPERPLLDSGRLRTLDRFACARCGQ